MVRAVRYTCRGDRGGKGLLDEPEDDARLVRQHDQMDDGCADKARAAQVDSDIEAFRERGKHRDASALASETAQLRELLDDRRDRPA